MPDFDKIIESILDQANSRKTRENQPLDSFLEHYKKANTLLDSIYSKILDKDLLQVACKQYLITQITNFEVYFKDLFKLIFRLCDETIVFEKAVKLPVDRKLKFEELFMFYQTKLGIEDLLCYFFNFQNLNEIKKIFNTFFGDNIFERLKNQSFPIGGSQTITLKENYFSDINKMIELRHKVVHDIDKTLIIEISELHSFRVTLLLFIIGFDLEFAALFLYSNLKPEFRDKSSKEIFENKE